MKISNSVRTAMDVFAIVALWFGVLVVVGLTALGDCFTPACGEAVDHRIRIELALVGIGFVSHMVGYFWLKSRRARFP